MNKLQKLLIATIVTFGMFHAISECRGPIGPLKSSVVELKEITGTMKSGQNLESLTKVESKVSDTSDNEKEVEETKEIEPSPTVLIMTATAYTHTGNATATGVMPKVGMIAVDPNVIPLGAKVHVKGYGYATATDTGGAIKGNVIDLFMDTRSECINWGRRTVEVTILE